MKSPYTDSLAHTTWECKYHIVFAPKFRRKEIYGKLKQEIRMILRELCRNSQLRITCDLSEGKYKYLRERKHLIPPARVFTGFLNKLKDCKTEIEEIFEELVKFMYENLEGFGEDCAIDGIKLRNIEK